MALATAVSHGCVFVPCCGLLDEAAPDGFDGLVAAVERAEVFELEFGVEAVAPSTDSTDWFDVGRVDHVPFDGLKRVLHRMTVDTLHDIRPRAALEGGAGPFCCACVVGPSSMAVRFDRALVTSNGLEVTWSDVPGPEEQSTLLLSVLARRRSQAIVQFGTKWIAGASDSPVVFAFDFETTKQRNLKDASAAIVRDGDSVQVTYPKAWINELIGEQESNAEAVVNVNGLDVSSVPFDLEPED